MNTCRDCNALTSGHCPQHPMVVSYPISTPTHSHKTILEYAKENKIKNRRWCRKCGLTEGDIDNGCKHDWKLHLLEDDALSPTKTVSDCPHGDTSIDRCEDCGKKRTTKEPTVEKWEEKLSQTLLDYEKQMVKDFKNTANWKTDWNTLYFSLSKLLSHSVQEAKAEVANKIQSILDSRVEGGETIRDLGRERLESLVASLKQEDV